MKAGVNFNCYLNKWYKNSISIYCERRIIFSITIKMIKCRCCEIKRSINQFSVQKKPVQFIKRHDGSWFNGSGKSKVDVESILNGEVLCDLCINELNKIKMPGTNGIYEKIGAIMCSEEIHSYFKELISTIEHMGYSTKKNKRTLISKKYDNKK